MKKLLSKKTNLTIIVIAVVILAFGGYKFMANKKVSKSIGFDSITIEKGSISNTVTATGTLEATNTVEVGTQVSGVVEKLYVDFNSRVKKGQLIAELDKATLQSTLDKAEASLYSVEAELEYQKSNYERMKTVFEKGLLSESDFDEARYNYKKTEASLKSAKAEVEKAKRNLGYATIYSPIDGIVLNRAVEEGQTVAASMSTPEIFTIANDLTEMQVEADIDEADIGMVQDGQRVEFTVDAFPDEIFKGEISEVRLQPTESSSVVTYTVIVSVQNPELKLKPGMTASITDYVEEVNNVLVLPGKATRFSPDREFMMSYMKSLPKSERPARPSGKGPENMPQGESMGSMPPPDQQGDASSENMKQVWIKDGALIKPVMVETGLNDGTSIEIISGLKEGDEVVTAINYNKTKEEDTTKAASSPFVPKGPGGGPGKRK